MENELLREKIARPEGGVPPAVPTWAMPGKRAQGRSSKAAGLRASALCLTEPSTPASSFRSGTPLEKLSGTSAECPIHRWQNTRFCWPAAYGASNRAETVTRESEAGFRLVAEHASDMVSRVGRDGARLYASLTEARILRVRPEAVLGRGMLECALAEGRRLIEAAMAHLLADAVEVERLEGAARALRDLDGRAGRLCGVTRDTTERRRAEAEREVHERELERSNAELACLTSRLVSRCVPKMACCVMRSCWSLFVLNCAIAEYFCYERGSPEREPKTMAIRYGKRLPK